MQWGFLKKLISGQVSVALTQEEKGHTLPHCAAAQKLQQAKKELCEPHLHSL